MTLFYRGRLEAPPAAGTIVLDEWGVLPTDLLPRLAGAGALVIADPVSFPFESLRAADWDTPMLVSLLGLVAEDITALDGVLHRLMPGDGVVADASNWASASAGRRLHPDLWLGSALDFAVERFLSGADRERKAALTARTGVLRTQLQHFHPGTAWDADGSLAPVRSVLPWYIEWRETGPAEAVVAGAGIPEESSRLRSLWDAVEPGGVLLVLADVVPVAGGPDPRRARQVRDLVLGAAPHGAALADVESIRVRTTPHRTNAVFAFTRGQA